MNRQRRERAEALSKLEILLVYGHVTVDRAKPRNDLFEVSVFDHDGEGHSHYGGSTIVEAIEKAYRATATLTASDPAAEVAE